MGFLSDDKLDEHLERYAIYNILAEKKKALVAEYKDYINL